MEETKQQSEERFRAMFEYAPLGIALVDSAGILLPSNQVFLEILGYSSEEFQNQPFSNFIHPDEQQRSNELFQELLFGKQTHFSLEQRYIRKDGCIIWGKVSVAAVCDGKGLFAEAIIMLQDISAQKQAQLTQQNTQAELEKQVIERTAELTQANLQLQQEIAECQNSKIVLQTQKDFLQAILDFDPNFIYVKDTTSKYVLVNQAYADFWGKTVDELVGKTFGELHSQPSEVENVMAHDQKLFNTLEIQFIPEEAYQISTGEVRWYQTIKKPLFDGNGQCQILGVCTDITERKQIEAALRESEQRYRLLIEKMNDGVIIVDQHGFISYINERFSEMTGYSPSEMIGHHCLEFGDEETRKTAQQQLARHRKAESGVYELPIIRKDGQKLLTITSATSILGTDGSFEGSFGVLTDITAFKTVESQLQQAKAQLRAVLDAVPGLISWISSDGRYLGVNQQLADNFNLPPDAFIGQELGFLQRHSEFTEFMEQFIASSSQTKRRVIDVQVSGLTRSYLIAAQKYNNGTAAVSVGIDITEGKLAEEQLRQREEQLRLALEASRMGFWDWNLQTGKVALSSNHEQMFGISLDTYEETNESFLAIVHPEDRDRVCLSDQYAIETGKMCEIEFRVIWPDGSIRWLEGKGQAYYDKTGKPVRLTGINLDITERKQAQLALNAQHQFLQTVIDTNPNLIFVKDIHGRYVMINQAYANFYGVSIEELLGKTNFTFKSNFIKAQEFAFQDQEVFTTSRQKFIPEETLYSKTGEPRWFQTIKRPLFDAAGQVYQILGVSTDITEHKQIEEQLRQSEAQLRLALDAARMGDWEWNLQTGKITFSTQLEQLYGFAPNTYDGTYETYVARLHPEDRERVHQATQLSINKGADRDLDFRIIWPDGSVHWIQSKGRVIYSAAGTPVLLSGISLDISERKFAECQLHESEAQLHRALEAARMGFWEMNIQTGSSIWSNNLEQLYGVAPNTYGGTYESFLELVHPQDRDLIQQEVQICLATGNDYNVEFRVVWADGSIHWMEGKGQVFYDEMGKPVRMTGIDMDISERKQAETDIKESLREKEVLLQEIHHRVKNNLQVISSLLDLQSQRLTDKAALEIFQESQNRIKLMALVHETLYKYKDFVRINFSEYAKTLIDYLFRAYKGELNDINLSLNLEEVHLKLDKAIPCGLIISELISNSLKYAFPNQAKGTIYLSLAFDENNYFRLMVKDDGVGFPHNWESGEVKSLGLQLVKVLTNQLDGTLELDHKDGTEFRISFLELDD